MLKDVSETISQVSKKPQNKEYSLERKGQKRVIFRNNAGSVTKIKLTGSKQNENGFNIE